MGQAEKGESDSITNQRNLLIDFISQISEFENARVLEFCDDGWSGKNFERPAVQKMLEMVKQGKIQCIVVKDFSRFGRDYLTVGNYLSYVFPFLGVRFIAVNNGFDSIRPMDIDKLEMSFSILLSDLYSRDLSRKVKGTKYMGAKRGEFLSPFAPYGYVKDDHNNKQLSIDPKAAQIVRRIFCLAAEGKSTLQIARILNKEQVLTPMQYKRATGCSRTVWTCVREENFWTHYTVTKILRDERYTGKTIYGKYTRDKVGKAHVVKVRQKDWITVNNTHKGIVSQEEFNHVQKQLRKFIEHDIAPSHKKGMGLYKKIRCGICGHIMARNKAKHPYYICRTPYVTSTYACVEEKILESDLLEVIQLELHMQVLCRVELCHIWEELCQQKKQKVRNLLQTISNQKGTCTRLERDRQELYERFVFGGLDRAGYLSEKTAIIKKYNAVVAKIEELETKRKELETKLQYPYTEKKELPIEIVSDVLKEIIIYSDNRINIVWNFQG